MAQRPEHPTIDLSSFEQSTCPLTQPNGRSTRVSTVSAAEAKESGKRGLPNKGTESPPPQDDQRIDLSRYGLPEALTKLNHALPEALDDLIKSSVENILSQVAAEGELRWRLHEEERGRLEENSEEARENGRGADKGKGVEHMPAVSTAAEGSSTLSEPFDSRSVPTPPPSEATTSLSTTEKPSPGTESEIEFPPEAAAAAAAAVDSQTTANIGPREHPSPTANTSCSSPSNPKKRHLLWTVFRRLSDSDPYLGLLRHHSTGELHHPDLRARLKKTKQALHRDQRTGECISCFDDFTPRDLVKLRCHNYCKPCFRRLIANALETEAQWPPKCCLNPIDHKTCLRNISGALSMKYMQKRQEYSTPIQSRYYCPIPDCGLFVPADKANTPFRRARCKSGHLTCMDCRQAAHTDAVQCVKNQDMELVQRLAVEEGWRRCHQCHTMIEHKNACRHITCRCGAQFCMVCGAVWWTCGCTEQQLDEIKQRAKRNSERRREQEERERLEIQELHRALEAIARMEAEEEEKLERTRAAKEARRKVQAESNHADLAALAGEVNEFQRGVLHGQHERDRRELLAQIQTAEEGLSCKHLARIDEMRTASERKVDEKEKELWEEYRAGPAQEAVTNSNGGGRTEPHPEGEALDEEDGGAEERWPRYRDEQLKQLRWAVEDEQAIEEELMQAKTARVLESFRVQQRELQAKISSELRWCELVVAERARLLEALLAAELENEIVDDDDYRWDTIVVQEVGEPGPSRYTLPGHC